MAEAAAGAESVGVVVLGKMAGIFGAAYLTTGGCSTRRTSGKGDGVPCAPLGVCAKRKLARRLGGGGGVKRMGGVGGLYATAGGSGVRGGIGGVGGVLTTTGSGGVGGLIEGDRPTRGGIAGVGGVLTTTGSGREGDTIVGDGEARVRPGGSGDGAGRRGRQGAEKRLRLLQRRIQFEGVLAGRFGLRRCGPAWPARRRDSSTPRPDEAHARTPDSSLPDALAWPAPGPD